MGRASLYSVSSSVMPYVKLGWCCLLGSCGRCTHTLYSSILGVGHLKLEKTIGTWCPHNKAVHYTVSESENCFVVES